MAFLFEDDKSKADFDQKMQPKIDQLQSAFQTNINSLYDKLVSLGSTPAAKTPAAITAATQAINDAIYNKLVSLGQTPASKTVANLNSKIQALTEVTWYYNISGDDVKGGKYDLTNVAELKLASWNGGIMDTIGASYYNASGSVISMETKTATGNFTIPSSAKSVTFAIVATSGSTTATVRFKYQTKALR